MVMKTARVTAAIYDYYDSGDGDEKYKNGVDDYDYDNDGSDKDDNKGKKELLMI